MGVSVKQEWLTPKSQVEELVEWCVKEAEVKRRDVEMMEAGTLATHQVDPATGHMEDHTAAAIRHDRQQIAELEDLLRRMRESGADDRP